MCTFLCLCATNSSANAKKWETELQTLKNNNARLTAALQESTTNVEEWKKQLNAYKEENIKLRKKVIFQTIIFFITSDKAEVLFNCFQRKIYNPVQACLQELAAGLFLC